MGYTAQNVLSLRMHVRAGYGDSSEPGFLYKYDVISRIGFKESVKGHISASHIDAHQQVVVRCITHRKGMSGARICS